MNQETSKTRRKVNEDDVKASGFRSLEGIGRVINVSSAENRVRVTIECCGLTCKMDTTAQGAKTAARIGLLTVGDRVLFRAKPIVFEGTTLLLGIVEVGSLGATGEDYCILNVEKWTPEGTALTGSLQLQFPSHIALAKPHRLAPRGDNGKVFWTLLPDEEGVEAIVN
jgi:hypothetical protein